MAVVVRVNELSFKYDSQESNVLESVSLTVEQGEFLCIVGPNGAGKSTLCYALVGLIPHFFGGTMSGEVVVAGLNTRDETVARLATKVGLVFQNPFNQLSNAALTVREELAFGLGNLGVPREEMLKRIDDVAKQVGIEALLDKVPYQLSGGQVQKVALASVLAMQPEILVLDEATSQLDPVGAEMVFEVAKSLNSKGITVIMVEHKVNEITEFADKVILLSGGKVILEGTPRDVFSSDKFEEHNVLPPQYTLMSRELKRQRCWEGPLATNFKEGEAGVRRIVNAKN